MKILFLTHYFMPHVGGVEKHVYELSKRLVKKGHRITIITTQHDKKIQLYEKNEFEIYRISYEFHDKKIATWNWILSHKHLFFNSDIIHIHDVFWWLLPIKVRFNKSFFITFHGYEGNKPPRVSAIIQRKISEVLSSGSICVGEFMKKWYIAKPTITIFGAISHMSNAAIDHSKSRDLFFYSRVNHGIKREIETETSHRATKTHKKNTAIYIGRMSQDVGIMDYLKALKILKGRKIDISLDVYGDGPQISIAKRYAIQNRLKVKFYGPDNSASEYIHKYEFVFVSRYLGLLEAFVAKRPVFAHFNNSIKYDYLNTHPQIKNFYIFDKPSVLAKYIENYEESGQKSKINIAYNWAIKQTWEKLTDQYLELWSVK